jgi:hypothetical protein
VGAEEKVAAGHLRQAGFCEDTGFLGRAASWRAASRIRYFQCELLKHFETLGGWVEGWKFGSSSVGVSLKDSLFFTLYLTFYLSLYKD